MPFPSPPFPSSFDVGTPGAGHMHFAEDGSQTLYGPDGVTVLARLDPVAGLEVNKGTIATADSGARVELTNDPSERINLYTGSADETQPGTVRVLTDVNGRGFLQLQTPQMQNHLRSVISLYGDDPTGTIHGEVIVVAAGTSSKITLTAGNKPLVWDGTALTIPNCTSPPSTNPTGGGYLYADAGALKYRGSSGTVTTIAPA